MKLQIRKEEKKDYAGIQKVHDLAFGQKGEGKLVSALRLAGHFSSEMSLVALSGEQIIGHILFSKIYLMGENGVQVHAAALAPMAVIPSEQRKGVGKLLISRGIESLKKLGYEAILVLGDPAYYQKSGFRLDLAKKIQSAYSGNHFMAMELRARSLEEIGIARAIYPKEFEMVG